MENMDKFVFPEPAPPDTVTLLGLCFRVIAKEFARFDHEALISDLPLHLVDNLKSYMTPRMLHDIMPFLEKRSVDTSYDWETYDLRAQFPRRYNDASFGIDSMRKSRKVGCTKDAFLITERRVNEFHHAYISGHCQKLLYDLFELKQGEVPYRYETYNQSEQAKVPTEKEIFRELLYFLPSVVSITIDLDIFRKLHLEQEIMNILIENLETLKIGDIGFFAASDPGRLTLAGAERISRILKNFCRSKVLKAIKFECGLCYDEWEWDRENVSAILKGLVANGKDEIASSQEASDYAVSSFEDDIEVVDGMTPYYMDTELEKRARDKIHKVDESWTDFQEILSEIKQSVKYSQTSYAKDKGKEALATGNIESVSLCINCFLHVGNFLPNWKTVRRLSFEGCLIRNAPSDGLARELLNRIACHQLTHLRLSGITCDDLVSRIMYILHEYYSKDTDIKGPMEMLHLYVDDNRGKESYPVLEDVIYAVKDYRGPCVGLDDANFSAYLTFFKKNVSLRHLDLEIRHSPVISCVQILDCLMESKVLQTLLLDGSPITHKDGINKADSLVKFLNQVKTLKKLSLKSCCIEGDTLRSKDLIESIQRHANLKVLCLGYNDMGPVGAEFLTALLMPADGVALNLMELDLNCCNIPGEDLLVAAENLKKRTVRRPLIDTLNIDSYMFKGNEDAEKALIENMKKEYGELTKYLHASFSGYNPYDPNSSDYHNEEDFDNWSSDDNGVDDEN